MSNSRLLTLLGTPAESIGQALEARANIVAATQDAEDAVLIPNQTGAWSHALRHALAARIAHLHGDPQAAEAYTAKIAAPELAAIADPGQDGAAQNLAHVCAFMDRVSADTRNVKASDIKALQDEGVSDADIVRLCELAAFLSYQLRVLAGVRLMGAQA